MPAYTWYQQLIKPWWAPPAFLFGPVWTFLYILITISFGRVFWLIAKKKMPPTMALPFGFNLLFNFIFTPIQFGLRSNMLAAVDILAVLGTLAWAMWAIYPRVRWIAYMQIPYLLWVSFAAILQLTITSLNF